jgi:N6-adenosine-specific RNA methylase IME4/ParB-like chromosome segregation protein Spo0J
MGREYHEVANIFPLMQGEEFDALKADIAANGLREAIWLHQDGSIIDGRNRYRACCELGAEPQYRTWNGSGSLVAFVVSLNLHRRHLTPIQRAGVAVDILPMLEVEAHARYLATVGRPSKSDQKIDQISERAQRAAEQAAAIVGTNRQYVADMKRYKDEAPEVFELARAGVVNGSGARKLASLDDDMRSVVVDKLRSGEHSDVQKALREAVDQKLSTYVAPMPTGKYRVIYADPPWSYGNTMPPGTTQPDEYYRLMSTPDIASMPVRDLAEDDAVLFLWTTSPHLEESFDVIRGWGFKYKTSFVWDKVKHNMGHYNSVRHEFLLVCVRGSCPPDVPKLFDSVQVCERGEHSVKPELFREIIDTIYPFGTRLELFARRPAPGWEVYGNEVN